LRIMPPSSIVPKLLWTHDNQFREQKSSPFLRPARTGGRLFSPAAICATLPPSKT
jgi:hypothetical protein